MLFYREHVYPHLVRILGNPEPIQKIRQRLLPLAHGEVLEIGVGPGVNFVHYDPARVSKVYALEPNQAMIWHAEEQRRRTQLHVEFLELPGEQIPLPNNSVDTVVSTFTLCTIPGVTAAIRGLARVLRPDGRLIFFELGLSPDPKVRSWQERSEPFFKLAFEGCYVTRHIPSLLKDGGFKIEELNEASLAPFPKSASYCFWGLARRSPESPTQPTARDTGS
jgi:ubiquinone/menaquinone biosynthesis C-methylase UbiE